MSATWKGGAPPTYPAITVAGWVRVVLRGTAMVAVILCGLVLLLLTRLIERPLNGLHRPVTPAITQGVCRAALSLMGLHRRVEGRPMTGRGAVVANHSSWLDIFALNAVKRIYFVSKSEVAGWPGIGWLARATGTVFIERNRARARAQTHLFRDRLLAGHKLLFFPEGTSTDGQQVLGFKTTLFEAFFAADLRDRIAVQPVSVVYRAPPGTDPRFYGWWGDMDLGPHLLHMLAQRRHGSVTVIYHQPLVVSEFSSRKALALACEAAVRAGHARLSAPD